MPVNNPTSAGLTKWVESETLYSGKYYNKLAVLSSQPNADAVISPKGTGGFSLQQADGTTIGGNARGLGAVDLQTSRTNANQVASGDSSFVAGKNCRATGISSSAIGDSCISFDYYAFAQGTACNASAASAFAQGNLCVASGVSSRAQGLLCEATTEYAIAQGRGCTSSGRASVAQGYNCLASGFYSFAGGNEASAVQQGATAWSSKAFNTAGDNQKMCMVISGTTTNTTPKILTADNTAGGTLNQLVLLNNQSKTFIATINAIVSGSTTRGASWVIKGRVSRGTSAATTVINFSTIETFWNPDNCVIAVTADTTNGAAAFTFTGVAATNIRVTAVIDCAETIYA